MCIGWLSSWFHIPTTPVWISAFQRDTMRFHSRILLAQLVLCLKQRSHTALRSKKHTRTPSNGHAHTHTQPSSIYLGRKVHYACACAGIISNEQRTRRKATSETTIQRSLWMKENEEVNNNVNRRHIHTQRAHTQTQQQQQHSPYTHGTN